MTYRGLSVLAIALCWAGVCAGQSAPPPQGGGGAAGMAVRVIDGVTHTISFTMNNSPSMPWGMVLAGAPYSAEEVEESVRTLADGSHQTQKRLNSRTCRDSLGRMRREMGFRPEDDPESRPAARVIDIQDPVANVQYRLELSTKIARRWDMAKVPSPETMVLAPLGVSSGEGLPPSPPPQPRPVNARRTELLPTPRPGPPMPAGAPTAPSNMAAVKFERLGTQVIDGLLMEGTRSTRIVPQGAQGNDRPMTMVSEQWSSPDLQVVVLSKTTDPRMGESTRSLIHLSRVEPDSSLFQPPPDYQVVDEQVSVTIDHRVQK